MKFFAEYFVAVFRFVRCFFFCSTFVCLFEFACEFASNGKSARDAQITNTSINWCTLRISCDWPNCDPWNAECRPEWERARSYGSNSRQSAQPANTDVVVCTAHQLLYIRFNFQIKQHSLQTRIWTDTIYSTIPFFCVWRLLRGRSCCESPPCTRQHQQ